VRHSFFDSPDGPFDGIDDEDVLSLARENSWNPWKSDQKSSWREIAV